ncbi:MAG: carboxypeptidase-like regulatory domain-containing protein, partial [Acidobacteriota bacterium]
MKQLVRSVALFALVLLAATSAFAQTTATLTGTVTTAGGALPGATVTISSPALQGTRTTITGSNGDYNIAALPPGRYTVRAELEGLQTITRTVDLRLADVGRVD